MRVLSVVGVSDSGKTTTIEAIIAELRRRGYSVGTVKEICCSDFALDEEGTDTHRHSLAGAEMVTAKGRGETDMMLKVPLSTGDILKYHSQDFVLLEGAEDLPVPKIIAARNVGEIRERLDDTVVAIAGCISNRLTRFENLPVLNARQTPGALVDLIEEKVGPLPSDPLGGGVSGFSGCPARYEVVGGGDVPSQCLVSQDAEIRLQIGGQEIELAPFVQEIVRTLMLDALCGRGDLMGNVSFDRQTGDRRRTPATGRWRGEKRYEGCGGPRRHCLASGGKYVRR